MASKSKRVSRAEARENAKPEEQQEKSVSPETLADKAEGPGKGQPTEPEDQDLTAAGTAPDPEPEAQDPDPDRQDRSEKIALSDIPQHRLGDDPLAEDAQLDLIANDELRGILEDLNTTLDNANTVLAGNHALAESMATTDTDELREPEKRGQWKFFTPPAIAATLGVGIGIVSLTVLWPAWNGQLYQSAEAVKDTSGVTETIIEREPARLPETAAAPVSPPPAATEAEPEAADIADLPPEPEAGQQVATASTVGIAPADIAEPPPDAEAAIETENAAQDKAVAETEAAQAEIVTAAIPAPPPVEPLSAKEEADITARGKTLIGAGDVGSARLVFSYAARRGSPQAMYALAQTYDPQYLALWKVRGLEAEMDTALKWYMKAAEAGHELAQGRLKTLIQAPPAQ